MVDLFKDLAGISTQLNQKSDKLNPIISSVNAKLAKLNLGAEVWLYDDPIEQSEAYVRTDEREDVHYCVDAVVFGYCRLDDAWKLALKKVTYDTAEGDEESERLEVSRAKRSLLEASRSARIKAVQLIPNLLSAIKEAGQSMLDGIEQAEKAAAELL